MAFFFTKVVRNVILLVILVNAIHFYLRWKSYVISAKDFKTDSNKAASNFLTDIFWDNFKMGPDYSKTSY